MFCKHDYEMMDKTVLPSVYERLMAWGQKPTDYRPSMHVTKLVILLKCKKCKHVKKIVESN